jgi:hypothetical protein
VILVALLACQQDTPKHVPPPEPAKPRLLEGDMPCGKHTCHSNQICMTEQAGHVCWTDADAGIGEYGIHDQYCMDVPAACHGVPSCDCMRCMGGICGVDGRNINCGCY